MSLCLLFLNCSRKKEDYSQEEEVTMLLFNH